MLFRSAAGKPPGGVLRSGPWRSSFPPLHRDSQAGESALLRGSRCGRIAARPMADDQPIATADRQRAQDAAAERTPPVNFEALFAGSNEDLTNVTRN